MKSRALALLIAKDNNTGEEETILLIAPFSVVQTNDLNAFVVNFCIEKNIRLIEPPEFIKWVPIKTHSEFQCKVCNQACLQKIIDLKKLVLSEEFCSNFCARKLNLKRVQCHALK
jgi:hypothetical protein